MLAGLKGTRGVGPDYGLHGCDRTRTQDGIMSAVLCVGRVGISTLKGRWLSAGSWVPLPSAQLLPLPQLPEASMVLHQGSGPTIFRDACNGFDRMPPASALAPDRC